MSTLIEWSDSFSVGIKTFDDHHKQLINLLNRAFTSIKEGSTNDRDEQKELIKELMQYTKLHFEAEEKEMEAAGYAGLKLHMIKHKEFIEQVRKFRDDFLAGKAAITLDLTNFLRKWLVEHIQQVDMQYSEPLKSAGVK